MARGGSTWPWVAPLAPGALPGPKEAPATTYTQMFDQKPNTFINQSLGLGGANLDDINSLNTRMLPRNFFKLLTGLPRATSRPPKS
jgi:hypothetical protein